MRVEGVPADGAEGMEGALTQSESASMLSLRVAAWKESRMSQSTDGVGCLLIVAFFGFVIWYVETDADWVVKHRAAEKYHIDESEITIAGPQPHDCEFMTAPLGSKHCHYTRDYFAEWLALSNSNPPRPIIYGTLQADPPSACADDNLDFSHRCYFQDLKPGERATNAWAARSVEIRWRKVED